MNESSSGSFNFTRKAVKINYLMTEWVPNYIISMKDMFTIILVICGCVVNSEMR